MVIFWKEKNLKDGYIGERKNILLIKHGIKIDRRWTTMDYSMLGIMIS